MVVVDDITNYADYLREQGILISFFCIDRSMNRFRAMLLPYEVHLPLICSYLKANENTKGMCIHNKSRLRAKTINEPYYACCFAGVEEYCIPLQYEDRTLAIVNISGYRGQLERSKIQRDILSKRCGMQYDLLYDMLNPNPPSLEDVEKFVMPLKYMFSELYRYCIKYPKSRTNSEKMYHEALSYIYNNYMNELDTAIIAKSTSYSESHLRRIFKEYSGVTIGKFINDFRLKTAKIMLEGTKLSITKIAADCGFYDANYFSTAFKRKYGISPRDIRKQQPYG